MAEPIAPNVVDYGLDPLTMDIAVSAGVPASVEGADAIAQGIRVRFSVWRGEWFYEPSEGLPVFQYLLTRGVPTEALTMVFDRALAKCPGVAARKSLGIIRDNAARTLAVDFVVQTTSGAILRAADFRPFVVSW